MRAFFYRVRRIRLASACAATAACALAAAAAVGAAAGEPSVQLRLSWNCSSHVVTADAKPQYGLRIDSVRFLLLTQDGKTLRQAVDNEGPFKVKWGMDGLPDRFVVRALVSVPGTRLVPKQTLSLEGTVKNCR